MYLRLRLYILLLTVTAISFCSCNKLSPSNNNNNNNNNNNLPPAITAVGTPTGTPVSKSIGASGGTIVSADGRIALNFPADALSTNTDIIVQPVTNQTPGGIGLSYHLMPDGIKFNKPVALTFHYTSEDVNGSNPYLLFIAYQDSLLTWKADLKKRNVDSVAKTVTLDISHFSIWSLGDRLNMIIDKQELHLNQQTGIHIIQIIRPSTESEDPDGLPSLPISDPYPDNGVSNWKINGQTENVLDGTIDGTGANVIYKTPSSIPHDRTVQISVELNHELSFYNNGVLVGSTNKMILFGDIKLLTDNYKFDIKFDFEQTGSAGSTIGGAVDKYTDGASAQIEIVGDAVNILNITNKKPNASPATGLAPDGETKIEWEGDEFGIINITSASGIVLRQLLNLVKVDFTHSGTQVPKWKYTQKDGTVYFIGGDHIAGVPPTVTFALTDSVQSIKDAINHSVVTITPIQ